MIMSVAPSSNCKRHDFAEFNTGERKMPIEGHQYINMRVTPVLKSAESMTLGTNFRSNENVK